MKNKIFLFLIIFMSFSLSAHASFWADIETGTVFTGYNDVQIPSEDGKDGGGSVYTFSLFHYAVFALNYEF
ncbi:MAG TPA: hypothetical protein DHW82_06605 [Spirochaetia bacterium]|nr:MAG: hypothetical protein A2Y41_08705 [Spirochaetes bacterium GWB1_36_13]HCL56664.1 hypothetical protein [Spirochaetia bacterium]